MTTPVGEADIYASQHQTESASNSFSIFNRLN
jgi:hypothetical protein